MVDDLNFTDYVVFDTDGELRVSFGRSDLATGLLRDDSDCWVDLFS